MAIPPAAVLNLRGHNEDRYTEPPLRLLQEMRSPHSRFKPYLDFMPGPNEVLSICKIPEEYLRYPCYLAAIG